MDNCANGSKPGCKGLGSDTAQLWFAFWSLDIDPPEAEKFI
jgi:hypothetical protein